MTAHQGQAIVEFSNRVARICGTFVPIGCGVGIVVCAEAIVIELAHPRHGPGVSRCGAGCENRAGCGMVAGLCHHIAAGADIHINVAALHARLSLLPATALRGEVLPERVPASGLLILRDGEPGEPEVTLSPLRHHYQHRAEIEAVVQGTDRDTAFDTLTASIGAAIAADRTLGGLCDWVEAEAPRPLPVIEVAEGAIDPRIILGLEAAAEDDMDARPSHHDDHDDHEHDDFESIVVDIPELQEPAALVAAIEGLARDHNILRIKGYAAVTGKPMRLLVQAVGARVRHQYDRPWSASEPRQGRLVVIAEHDDINPDVIRAALGNAQSQAAE